MANIRPHNETRRVSVSTTSQGEAAPIAPSESGHSRQRSHRADPAPTTQRYRCDDSSANTNNRLQMTRIAVVGHPASGYQEALALLEQSGMTTARPSRRDGLRPQDINATLMAAHKAPPVSAVLNEDGFSPIETGPVWHGMALDLMLGNLDEPLWGWADPQAIYTLDFWKDVDPQLTFVLVYDEPHRVLMDAARVQGEPPSAEGLHRLLDNWIAYNSTLLRFYLRHPTRSVLVHTQQARRAVGTYLQLLQPVLGAPLTVPDLNADSDIDALASAPHDAPLLSGVFGQVVAAAGVEPRQAAFLLAAGAAERYLVDDVLAKHHRAQQLHAELQSAASLPLDRQGDVANDAAVAWKALATQRSFVASLLEQIHAKYQGASEELSQARTRLDDARAEQARENKCLSDQLRQLQHALDAEKAKTAQQRNEREKVSGEYYKKLQEVGAENELLLTQLHHVQEELERIFLRKRELEQSDAHNAARYQAATEHASERIKGLSQRLKNASQRLKEADQRLSENAQEAERTRQHISYRMGQVLLRHGRTPWGWLIVPFALLREVRAYRKQRQAASGSIKAK